MTEYWTLIGRGRVLGTTVKQECMCAGIYRKNLYRKEKRCLHAAPVAFSSAEKESCSLSESVKLCAEDGHVNMTSTFFLLFLFWVHIVSYVLCACEERYYSTMDSIYNSIVPKKKKSSSEITTSSRVLHV